MSKAKESITSLISETTTDKVLDFIKTMVDQENKKDEMKAETKVANAVAEVQLSIARIAQAEVNKVEKALRDMDPTAKNYADMLRNLSSVRGILSGIY